MRKKYFQREFIMHYEIKDEKRKGVTEKYSDFVLAKKRFFKLIDWKSFIADCKKFEKSNNCGYFFKGKNYRKKAAEKEMKKALKNNLFYEWLGMKIEKIEVK
jgi:hypothetical protein